MAVWDDLWTEFESQAGPILSDELSAQAPVSNDENDPAPGTLADSMVWEDRDGDTLTVGSKDPRGPIGAYVTRGTSWHPIDPVNGEFLHFFVGGDEVFARHVDHPGTQPNPFHIAAWENQRDQVHQLFYEIMPHGMAMSYLNPWRNKTLGE